MSVPLKISEVDDSNEGAPKRMPGSMEAPTGADERQKSLSQALARNTVLEKQVEKLLGDNHALLNHKRATEEILQGVLQSKSWRITAPLRKISELKRSFLPLFRWRRFPFTLRAGKNVSIAGASVSIHGPSPTIYLDSANGSYPVGWVRLAGKLTSKQGRLAFILCQDLGKGFVEHQQRWIALEDAELSGDLVQLPQGIVNLRLDPFQTSQEFALSDVYCQELGKAQVVFHLLKRHVRPAFKNPYIFWAKLRRVVAVLRSGGITALKAKLFVNQSSGDYQEWVDKYDTLSDADRHGIKEHIKSFRVKPLISLVMPTYNTPERLLRLALDSVTRQLYPNWELCIADDASDETHVRRILEEYARKDSRIRTFFREKNGHISEASNSALELARGEFIALLDHDDEITEHALYMVANEINLNPGANLIYSDEDKKTSYGLRFNPHFKSDWNPELFNCQNYVCHLGVYRAGIVRDVGGFRKGVEGAQDWDLALRVIDKVNGQGVHHIPHVLYHWRVVEGSTAQATDFKPYVLKSQQRAVSDHLERCGIGEAEVKILRDIAHLRVLYPVPKPVPLVSIIIPTRDLLQLLKRCVDTILEKTSYANYEILIIDNGSIENDTLDYLLKISEQPNVRIIHDDSPFNFSRLNNSAVKEARGELLAFLNNDLEVIHGDWLDEMVSFAVQPGVGAVGARLLFPNDLVQHAGVTLGIGGVAGHSFKGARREDPGYFNRAILPQTVSAVTAACMVVSRRTFDEAGGFDEKELSVAFNDIDLCLKIRSLGYRNVYLPYAELYHHESASRGYEVTPEKFLRFEGEIENMKRRWGKVLENDPFYNPNLTLLREDFTFAFPPRALKPWKQF